MITIHVTTENAIYLPSGDCISVRFPEMHNGMPLTPAQIIARTRDILADSTCEDIVTTSEHVILTVLHAVRAGIVPLESVEVHWHGTMPDMPLEIVSRHLRIDREGDFVDRWPRGFFD